VDGFWAVTGRRSTPPLTRVLTEQLSTAHWFDQRRTRAVLRWRPEVGLDEGFARLAAWYADTVSGTRGRPGQRRQAPDRSRVRK
jgi:nucleoside-diphosphate-sugar epimerase